jgi:hypothetical protein
MADRPEEPESRGKSPASGELVPFDDRDSQVLEGQVVASSPSALVNGLGSTAGILAAAAVVVLALLVAAGETFVTGTEVLEAAVYAVVFSGVAGGIFVVLSRPTKVPARPVVTTEDRLAVASAVALLAADGPQQRLEGALRLEALAEARPDLAASAAQALEDLVAGAHAKESSLPRRVVLVAVQALSRLNPLLRAQGRLLCLRHADLTGMDLSGLDFRGADLSGADLTGASLAGADLTAARLTGASIGTADLTAANLEFAQLDTASPAVLIAAGAQLRGALIPADGKGAR